MIVTAARVHDCLEDCLGGGGGVIGKGRIRPFLPLPVELRHQLKLPPASILLVHKRRVRRRRGRYLSDSPVDHPTEKEFN